PTLAATVDQFVNLLNPNIYALDENGNPIIVTKNPFNAPASDVARRVVSMTWFSSIVFLPFLVLPLVLLLVVIWKFRDRGDGRKPATFTHNARIEIIWTAIPCLALAVVALPVYEVLYYMELPPAEKKDQQVITVTGRQFAWAYEYKGIYKDPNAAKKESLSTSLDVAFLQEPVVLTKGRTVVLNITSQDVNHAWWIPAFGVKKDAIMGRFTNTWFTPDTLGIYKGQCAELCGRDHGIMLISAVVVDDDTAARYYELLRHRDDTGPVWDAIKPAPGTAFDADKLKAAVAAYLGKEPSAAHRFALSYWIASNYASWLRGLPPANSSFAEQLGIAKPVGDARQADKALQDAVRARRKLVDDQLAAVTIPVPAGEPALAAHQAP
ncbi:MAG: cytochrome c oxidase subunit II, partial [Planctomycetes bacterium]|nr:cytochrome c oxidase subunit II [Planctomycetota bacterium]